MWDISSVKARGREAFKANYWPCMAVSFIYLLFFGGSGSAASSSRPEVSSSIDRLTDEQAAVFLTMLLGVLTVAGLVGLLIKIFLANPIEVGSARFFQRNIERRGARFAVLGEGFSDYGHVFVTLLLRDLSIFLWSLLLVVPGIMKAYSYRLVPYIVKDDPGLSSSDVLRRSEELMRGNRWRSFLLDLSFFGWYLLGGLTLGLGIVFWTGPYVQSTNAALYLELSR